MMRRSYKKRALALTMAAMITAGCAIPAQAAAIGDGVTPTYDEAYYATLDYYGNLLEGSVVKSYALNGGSALTDYGVYDQVVNLTDGTPAVIDGGRTTFQFTQAPSHFYFEGKTAAPFYELPWTISLGYTLNGVPVRGEDLAGKTGVVEIHLDIVPNERAGDYARYNYTLEAMAVFNEDDILSLEAPGAQVQLVGNLRTVLFLALPGEERHFTIRVGSEDFSFGGLTVLMAPATLAQLEEIAKLSERKDDLEQDYRDLSGSLDALLDALNDVQGGLYASAGGLDQLDTARVTISKGKGQLYDDAGVLRSDLSNIADRMEPVEQRALHLSQSITDSKAVLGSMTDTVVSLRTQLDDLEEALEGLESGASDVRQVIRGLADMKSSLRSLQRALGDTHIGGGSSGDRNDLSLKEKVEKTKQVHSIYAEKDSSKFFNQMMGLQGKSQSEIASMNKLLGLDEDEVKDTPNYKAWQQAQAAKKQMTNLHNGIQGGAVDFGKFCDTLHQAAPDKISKEEAKQMSDLWTVYNSGPVKKPGGTGGTDSGGTGGTDSGGTGGTDNGETGGTDSGETSGTDSGETGGADNGETGGTDSGETGGTDSGETGSADSGETGSADSGETGGADSGETGGTDRGEAGGSDDTNRNSDGEIGGGLANTMSLASMIGPGVGRMSGALIGSSIYLAAEPSEGDSGGSSSSGESSGTGSGSSNSGESSGTGSGSSSNGESSGTGSGSSSSGESSGTDGGSSSSGESSGTDSGSSSGGGSGSTGSGSSGGGDSSSGGQTVGGAAVDLIVDGLDDAMNKANDRINAIQSELNSTINRITRPSGRVIGELADLCDDVDDLVDLIDDAEDLSYALRQSSEKLQSILDDVDALRNVLDEYEPTLQEAVTNVGQLSTSAVTTLRDLETLLADTESLMKTSGNQLDDGTRQTLRGLADALRQTAKAMAATGDVKDAKATINDIIEDTWHEYTGEVNNILLMDAEAEAVSLTDSRNPAPSSVQILIRTQEIKTEELTVEEMAAAAPPATTFWDRVVQMFQDFWNAITSVFH